MALRCSDEEELLLLQAKAQSLNLCARSIQDAWVLRASSLVIGLVHGLIFYCFRGRTQVAAGSRTVLGIGPGVYSLTFLESEVILDRSGSVDQPSDGKVEAAMNAYT